MSTLKGETVLTDKERTAVAMLRSGSSFKDASGLTGISVDRLRDIWVEKGRYYRAPSLSEACQPLVKRTDR